jgi:hypothetical protein
MPVPLEVTFEDGTSQRRYTDRLLKENVLTFTSKAPIREVRVDPDDALAMEAFTSGQ